MNFVVPADNRVKLKEREKRDKYLDPAREMKYLWNMNNIFYFVSLHFSRFLVLSFRYVEVDTINSANN